MKQRTRTYSQNSASSRTRSVSIPMWAALVSGGSLAIAGLARRSASGVAMAAAGGLLVYAGTKSGSARQTGPAHTSVIVNTTPEEVYRFWRNFERMPLFMNHIESIEKTGDRTYRWVAIGPLGTKIHWDAEVVNEREGESFEWHSLPGSDIQVNGKVEIRKAPQDRGTLVSTTLEYHPGSKAASSVVRFLNKTVNFILRQDLRRAKALIETGEIPTIEGQPHGPRDVATGVMRVLDPTRPPHGNFAVRDVIEARRKVS